ncbi:LacI family transcriptional regulator [Tyzzerella sp. OttesenSCG-928-J15]|nr:LacI family transcriptional regulator [Tyzzerella sp. OttesenSCG-928-J15]
MATIRDVAKEAGVSISTVSIVINGQAAERKIPPLTQEKVMDAIKKLNYQPNLSARKLRSTASEEYIIGIYWALDTRTMILSRFLQGLQHEVINKEKNIRIVVHPFVSGKLKDDKALYSLSSYNAAVIATINQIDLEFLEENVPDIPVVLLNRESEQYSGVVVDNAEAGRLAAVQFLQKGIKNIGAVLARDSFLALGRRRQSFLDTCNEYGQPVNENNIAYNDDTIEGGYSAVMELVKRGNMPKALYFDDDIMALGALSALNQSGINVPDDIELVTIGMASPELARFSVPPLTVVEIPIEEMASECVNILYDLLERRYEGSKTVRFDLKLYIRESCHPLGISKSK